MLTPDKVSKEHLDQIAVWDNTHLQLAYALENVFEQLWKVHRVVPCFYILWVLYDGYNVYIGATLSDGEFGNTPDRTPDKGTLYAYTLLWLLDDQREFFQERLSLEVEVYQALGYESRDMIGALIAGQKRLDVYNKPFAVE